MFDATVNCTLDCVFYQSSVYYVFVDVGGAPEGTFPSGRACEVEVNHNGCVVSVYVVVSFVRDAFYVGY